LALAGVLLVAGGAEGAQPTDVVTSNTDFDTAMGTDALLSNTTSFLGVLASSERYKTAIAPLGPNSAKLGQLRPVSFHLKSDPTGAVQYGLIAEDVDKVYPELVIRDQAGEIQGVRYEELAPMLLREVQQQASEIRHLKQQARPTKRW
jgi:hypothetical protein